jgi:hypothetical protein
MQKLMRTQAQLEKPWLRARRHKRLFIAKIAGTTRGAPVIAQC